MCPSGIATHSACCGFLQLLGRAIKHLPRDQIVVATKVGKYRAGEPADFSAARVTKSVHESLERMQLKYIDLIQVHDIEFAKDMREVCSARGCCCYLQQLEIPVCMQFAARRS